MFQKSLTFYNTNINKVMNMMMILLFFTVPINKPITNAIAGILLLLWFLEARFRDKLVNFKKNISLSLCFYFMFLFILFLSLFWSESLNHGFWNKHFTNGFKFYFGHYFIYSFLVVIILTSFKKENTSKAISAFLLAIFISELVSYGIILEFWPNPLGNVGNPSPFLSHVVYSTFLAIAIFILAYKVNYEKRLKVKVFYWLFILSATVNLFLNGGRTGQLLFAVLLFSFFIYKYKLRIKTLVLFLLVSFFVYFIAYNTSAMFKIRSNQAIIDVNKIFEGDYSTSWGLRFQSFIISKDLFLEKPILGYGLGSAKEAYHSKSKDYSNTEMFTKVMDTPHNQFSQIALETGLFGLIPFVLFVLLFVREKYIDEVKYIAFMIMLAFAFMFMVKSVFETRLAYILFLIFIALFSLNRKEIKEE